MGIVVKLDHVMLDRKMSLNELAQNVGITTANMSNIKTGKVKAIRFSTLEGICRVLKCQPADILEFKDDDNKSDLL
ncbi:MAG: helix-turn-helix transcriptional regulator [Bacilli bacterium]|jgi:putative transcriptional regulator|nr:helix-turn-helix transcriptional regulator [Bacilli bacterium]